MSFADKVSALRIFLIPFFVAILFYFDAEHLHLKYAAIAVFGLAVLSDFFDGLVARIKKEKSAFGTVIDPLADKLLLLTAFISVYLLRDSLPLRFMFPWWVVLVVVSRDIIILLGVLILHLLKLEIPTSPTLWGKLTTFFQMATILGVLIELPLAYIIWTLAVFFTVISGIGYIVRGVRSINVSDIAPGR